MSRPAIAGGSGDTLRIAYRATGPRATRHRWDPVVRPADSRVVAREFLWGQSSSCPGAMAGLLAQLRAAEDREHTGGIPLSQLYALTPAGSNSTARKHDCPAHRHGNAEARPHRGPKGSTRATRPAIRSIRPSKASGQRAGSTL
jgi:hypothetical protein